MYQAILFDIDGVIIRPDKYYSSFLENNGFPGALKSIDAFYKQDISCTIGTENPLVNVEKYLKDFNWNKSAELFFIEQYKYESAFIDYLLLDKIKKLRNKNILCFLATDQNHHRKDYILREWKFSNYFNDHFVSANIGYRKVNNEYWEYVVNSLKKRGIFQENKILFIDDRIENIKKAKEFGFNSFHVSHKESIKELYELIEEISLTTVST